MACRKVGQGTLVCCEKERGVIYREVCWVEGRGVVYREVCWVEGRGGLQGRGRGCGLQGRVLGRGKRCGLLLGRGKGVVTNELTMEGIITSATSALGVLLEYSTRWCVFPAIHHLSQQHSSH